MRDALKFVTGSSIVYLAMASCAGGSHSSSGGDDDSGSGGSHAGMQASAGRGGGSHGGTSAGRTSSAGTTSSSTGGSSGAMITDASFDAIMDALTDPVPDADAQTTDDTVSCVAGPLFATATKEYPGATVRELANIIVYGTLINTNGGVTHGRPTDVTFRDGAVVVSCGAISTQVYSSITFIRP